MNSEYIGGNKGCQNFDGNKGFDNIDENKGYEENSMKIRSMKNFT